MDVQGISGVELLYFLVAFILDQDTNNVKEIIRL